MRQLRQLPQWLVSNFLVKLARPHVGLRPRCNAWYGDVPLERHDLHSWLFEFPCCRERPNPPKTQPAKKGTFEPHPDWENTVKIDFEGRRRDFRNCARFFLVTFFAGSGRFWCCFLFVNFPCFLELLFLGVVLPHLLGDIQDHFESILSIFPSFLWKIRQLHQKWANFRPF